MYLNDPVGSGQDVVIDERDDQALGGRDGSIARVTQALARLEDAAHGDGYRLRKRRDHRPGLILRVVVHHNDFPAERIGHLLGGEGCERSLEEVGSLVGGNDNADLDLHAGSDDIEGPHPA